MRNCGRSTPRRETGFSLLELLVVVFIIMVMAAAALPNIGGYIKLYKIRGAAADLVGEIQSARNKAVMKNVNRGVVFLIMNETQYRYVFEDDVEPPILQTNIPVSTIIANNCGNTSSTTPPDDFSLRCGPLRTLPAGIKFGTGCATPMTFTPNDSGFRFNRLGLACDPLTAAGSRCPEDIGAGQTAVFNDAAGQTGSWICLVQPGKQTITRWVTVSPGGRAMAQR